MKYLLLEVIGRREYRGHKPGEQFVTRLDPALQRGIERGNVTVVSEIEPGLREGTYGFPDDWPTRADAAQTEAPRGASLIGKGGKA